MNKIKLLAVTGLATVLGAPVLLADTYNPVTETTAMVTNAGTLVQAIFPIVGSVVAFGILISLVKLVRRK